MKRCCNQILVLFLFCIANSSFGQYKNISKDSVKDSLKLNVYNFAYGLLDFCGESSLPKLDSTNANQSFIDRFDMALIYDSCEELSLKFGKIKEIELIEILKDKNDFQIFRYKFKREKSKKEFQFVIYLSKAGKFAGIEDSGYWSDKYTKSKRRGQLKHIALKGLSERQLKDIQDLAFTSYNKCEVKEFRVLTKMNAAPKMLKRRTPKVRLHECDSIKRKLGNFKNLLLTDGLTDMASIIIYRFKADFEKLDDISEIRIYYTADEKLMGIFVIDKWWDEFYDLKIALKKVKEGVN
jgi:hypothetical protein